MGKKAHSPQIRSARAEYTTHSFIELTLGRKLQFAGFEPCHIQRVSFGQPVVPVFRIARHQNSRNRPARRDFKELRKSGELLGASLRITGPARAEPQRRGVELDIFQGKHVETGAAVRSAGA